MGPRVGKLLVETFEEIDKELKKFDSDAKVLPKNRACTGKENFLESLSINDSPTLFTQQACAYYPSATPRIPPSVLPATLSKLVTNEGTWKRISRSNIGTNIVMEEAVGEKGSAGGTESQSEL